MRRFLIIVLSIGLLTLVQAFGFSISGVKPNLALAAVIAASFFAANFLEGFFPAILSVLILKFSPAFEAEILIFPLIFLGAVILKNRLPWRNFLNNLSLIAAGTLAFYLALAPKLVVSLLFLKELFLNLAAGILIFAFLLFLRQNKFV